MLDVKLNNNYKQRLIASEYFPQRVGRDSLEKEAAVERVPSKETIPLCEPLRCG